MIKLTQGQIENLRQFAEFKRQESKEMTGMVQATSKPIVCSPTEVGDSVDNQTRTYDANLKALVSFAEYLLENNEIIEAVDDGKVHVGTTFNATLNFDGKLIPTTKTLVETLLPGDDNKNISLESALGKAILGKSVGETFDYTQCGNTITITINEIIKDKKLTR